MNFTKSFSIDALLTQMHCGVFNQSYISIHCPQMHCGVLNQSDISIHLPQMGLLHKEDRNYTEARLLFERARDIEPSSPSIHHYITAVYASCVM